MPRAPRSTDLTAPADLCTCGGHGDVLETRRRSDGSLRRSRVCIVCSTRWTTIEQRVVANGDSVVLLPRSRVEKLRVMATELAAMLPRKD